MQLIVSLDAQGVKSVEIESTPDERQQAHYLFQTLRPAIEKLGIAAQEAGREIESGEADSQIPYGDVIAKG